MVDDIAYLQARGDFVLAIDDQERKFPLNYSLQHIESVLDPIEFFRINRSEMIRFDRIHHFTSYTKNRLAIHLKTTSTILYTSNSRSAAFKAWLER